MAFVKKVVYGLVATSCIQVCNGAINFSGADSSFNLNNTNSKLTVTTPLSISSGTLKLRVADVNNVESSGGNAITFSGDASIATSNKNKYFMTGTFTPGGAGVADTITLNNGNVLAAFEGNTVDQVVSVAASANATLLGSPTFNGSITLGSNSTLNLGVNQKVNQSIDLGGSGTLVLLDDISMKDGAVFLNNGTIDMGSSALTIISVKSQAAWTNTLVFKRAYDIKFFGNLALNSGAMWKFVTDSSDNFSALNGNGSILDLSAGGALEVGQGHTLYISDAHIILGTSGGLTFASGGNPGKFVLSNVTLELTGNYIQSGGEIRVAGGNVRLVTGGNKTWTISGSSSVFSSVGQIVIYDTLGGSNNSPFITASGGTINMSDFRSAISGIVPVDIVIDAVSVVANQSSLASLTNNYELVSVSKINVTNTSGLAKAITIDGGSYVWKFSGNGIPAISIANNTTVTLTNVVLKNFNINNINLNSSGVLRFGDGCVISLDSELNLYDSTKTIYCTGNVRIQGNGNIIDLPITGAMAQFGAGKTLTVENARINWGNQTGLFCFDDTARMAIKDCSVVFQRVSGSSSFTFGQGNMDIYGYCRFFATVQDSSLITDVASFGWYSKGLLTVKSGATLEVKRGINLVYSPDITGLSAFLQKRRILLEDNSSTLVLDDCQLTSTSPGMAFDQGNIVCNNNSLVTCSSTLADALEVATGVNIEILSSAVFSVNGAVKF